MVAQRGQCQGNGLAGWPTKATGIVSILTFSWVSDWSRCSRACSIDESQTAGETKKRMRIRGKHEVNASFFQRIFLPGNDKWGTLFGFAQRKETHIRPYFRPSVLLVRFGQILKHPVDLFVCLSVVQTGYQSDCLKTSVHPAFSRHCGRFVKMVFNTVYFRKSRRRFQAFAAV